MPLKVLSKSRPIILLKYEMSSIVGVKAKEPFQEKTHVTHIKSDDDQDQKSAASNQGYSSTSSFPVGCEAGCFHGLPEYFHPLIIPANKNIGEINLSALIFQ